MGMARGGLERMGENWGGLGKDGRGGRGGGRSLREVSVLLG